MLEFSFQTVNFLPRKQLRDRRWAGAFENALAEFLSQSVASGKGLFLRVVGCKHLNGITYVA